jgi:putative transposase
VCAVFGIAPKTGYKWLHQFETAGPAGLQDRSRRPKSNSRSVTPAVAERLVALRRENMTWGPKKLVSWLETNEAQWDVPAPSTVGELLKRRGLVERRTRSRPQRPRLDPLRHADKPNAVWSMDYKGWCRLGDGTRCDPLTVTDAFSRYLICCKGMTFGGGNWLGNDAWEALIRAFKMYGMPTALRVDNSQPWVAPKGSLGLTKLSVNIMKVGIALERIDPGKPYQNGRHERFHLTLQQDTMRPPSHNMRAQQHRFDAFRRKYNEDRPHEALGQRVPGQLYVSSRRSFPSRIEDPEYPRWYEVIRLRHSGTLHFHGSEYFISQALRNECVGFVEVEEQCFELYFCKSLLGRIHAAHPELGFMAA